MTAPLPDRLAQAIHVRTCTHPTWPGCTGPTEDDYHAARALLPLIEAEGIRREAHRVDQTIFADTPGRLGNCVAACIASYLGVRLDQVPHVLEDGAALHRQTDADGDDRTHWWAMTLGYFAAHGLTPYQLDSIDDGGEPGELLWVMGMSPRGVCHQVLYRDGRLWHDPHPSRAGVLDVREVLAWRPVRYDHNAQEDK